MTKQEWEHRLSKICEKVSRLRDKTYEAEKEWFYSRENEEKCRQRYEQLKREKEAAELEMERMFQEHNKEYPIKER